MSWGRGDDDEDEDKIEVLGCDAATPAIRLDKVDAKVCKPMDKCSRRASNAGTKLCAGR
jgi:hypothetical protein